MAAPLNTIHEEEEEELQPADKKPFQCPQCQKGFNREHHVISHLQCRHLNERAFECPHCPAKFNLKACLTRHLKRTSHLQEAVPKFLCGHCPARFFRAHDVTQHVLTAHDGQYKFPCLLCPLKFKSMSNFELHTQSCSLQLIRCPLCSSRFRSNETLLKHTRNKH
jgi:uncharacterized C2H2 Zn-finger protein